MGDDVLVDSSHVLMGVSELITMVSQEMDQGDLLFLFELGPDQNGLLRVVRVDAKFLKVLDNA